MKKIVSLFIACMFSLALAGQDREAFGKVATKFEKQAMGIQVLQATDDLIAVQTLLNTLLNDIAQEVAGLGGNNCTGVYQSYLSDITYLLKKKQGALRNADIDTMYFSKLSDDLLSLTDMNKTRLPVPCVALIPLWDIGTQRRKGVINASEVAYKKNHDEAKFFQDYHKQLQDLLKIDSEFNAYSGKVGFNYTSNVVERNHQEIQDKNNYVIGIEAEINKNIHPGEFNFKSDFNVNVDGSRFREQVSNIFMSFDYDVNKAPEKIGNEIFGFLSRYNNSYLDVNQRYEVGFGYVHDFINSGYSKKGEANKKKIKKLESHLKVEGDKKRIYKCSKNICQAYPQYANITAEDIKTAETFRKHVSAVNQKKFRRHRLGFLVGFFLEFEQISVSDSITISDLDTVIANPVTFEPTQNPRLEIRPHYTGYFGENTSISLKPYFIFSVPIAKSNTIRITNEAGQIIETFEDVRMVLEADLKVNLGKAEFKFSTVYNYDWSPRSALYKIGSEERLYSAPEQHLLTKVTFSYTFD